MTVDPSVGETLYFLKNKASHLTNCIPPSFCGPFSDFILLREQGEVYNRISFVCNLFLIDANKPVN